MIARTTSAITAAATATSCGAMTNVIVVIVALGLCVASAIAPPAVRVMPRDSCQEPETLRGRVA
jgi:hypothetical protein